MALERCMHTVDDFRCCIGTASPAKQVVKGGVIRGDIRVPWCGCRQHGISEKTVWHWNGEHWDDRCLPPEAR